MSCMTYCVCNGQYQAILADHFYDSYVNMEIHSSVGFNVSLSDDIIKHQAAVRSVNFFFCFFSFEYD